MNDDIVFSVHETNIERKLRSYGLMRATITELRTGTDFGMKSGSAKVRSAKNVSAKSVQVSIKHVSGKSKKAQSACVKKLERDECERAGHILQERAELERADSQRDGSERAERELEGIERAEHELFDRELLIVRAQILIVSNVNDPLPPIGNVASEDVPMMRLLMLKVHST